MRERYEEELQKLNALLTQMGNRIVESIGEAIEALVQQDKTKAQSIIDSDTEINGKQREIENLCMRLILEQQPVASDLRTISSALKMVTDMERIGDHAADISEITVLLKSLPYTADFKDIQSMAAKAMDMLVRAVSAFVNRDIGEARNVILQDDVVDDLFRQVKTDIIEGIHSNMENGEQAIDLLMVAKYLERIGDHATNIAEWVIFSITGERVDN